MNSADIENKQLKEAINRAIEELKKGLHELDTRRREDVYVEEYLEESIEILEETSATIRCTSAPPIATSSIKGL